uniref:Peptidase S1 domain-containing protein n=1 Tax=Anopheles culicifacies TaxID=139723 RepID=A0A182MU77_9DIPT
MAEEMTALVLHRKTGVQYPHGPFLRNKDGLLTIQKRGIIKPLMSLEETRRTQRPYRYGMMLLCVGALVNWLGLAENYSEPSDDPVHVISTTEERRREKPPDYDTVAAAPPSYDDAIKLDPAALLRLSIASDININTLASHPSDLLYDQDCVVTGWGRTLNDEESYSLLRAVEIPLISRALCNISYDGKIDVAMICAGDYANGGKGTCAYDSGGPLVCAGVQVGIVSWGKGCALPGFPEVYSSVLYARKWIDRTIKMYID